MYFVKDNKKLYWQNNKKNFDNNVFDILKVENDKIEEITIEKQNLLGNIKTNDVLKIEDGDFKLDDINTDELKEEILNMASDIIEKQNIELENYRKENHLYEICEEIGNNRFLKDITENNGFEFEEVDIPEDLLDKAVEGMILKFVDGKYELVE